jgi:cell division protein FtsL
VEGGGMMAQIFERRWRGFRVVELAGIAVLMVLMLVVYLAKTMAGTERAQIAHIERQIGDEKVRMRLLQAEVAHLEQPSRIEALSRQYLGLQPISAKQEIKPDALSTIAGGASHP